MTVFNTVGKIGRRFASELNNLVAKVLEQSNISNTTSLEVQAVDKGRWNTVTKLKRRKISELQGLNMAIVQESFREYNTKITGIKTIKPVKTYINKTKLFFKYSNKNKH